MARHRSPRGRHAHVAERKQATPPLDATALYTKAVDTKTPRRGVTFAAVAGGALSLAGATTAIWFAVANAPASVEGNNAVLSLDVAPAALNTGSGDQGGEQGNDDESDLPDRLSTLDPAAVMESVREAGRQAGRMTEQRDAQARWEAEMSRQADAARDAELKKKAKEADERDDESVAPSRGNGSGSNGTGNGTSNGNSDNDNDDRRSSNDNSDNDNGGDDSSDDGDGGSTDGGSTDGGSTSGGSTSGGDAAAGLGTLALPPVADGAGPQSMAQIFDPRGWYLTLPTGKDGDPDIIEESKLAGYSSKFFQLQPRNGIVFTANAGGATTSGSHYPRSELREMNAGEKASWSGRKGTHTMDIVQAITKTPKVKPDVIAGQIHATSDDLMQIHLSGKNLRVKYADGKKFVDLDPNYQLGTMFSVRIQSSEGKVKVWYNGKLKADLNISSNTSYFKAGVYTNSNTSKGADASDVGQVVIRSLTVRHG